MMDIPSLSQLLSGYIGLSTNDIRQIIELPVEKVFEDETFKTLIEGLDTDLLTETLPEAQHAYATGMPTIMVRLEEETGVEQISISTYMMTDWVIRFLEAPETIPVVLTMHQRLMLPAIRQGLPQLLEMLTTMPRGRVQWQQALAIMSLPLVAKS